MNIQIASDLHLEHWQRNLPPLHLFTPDRTRDLLILAGDVTDGKTDFGLPFLTRELDVSPVIYVPGNHEYYYASRQKVDDWWRAFARTHPGFHYLNDETVEIGGLRLYGACWCSDFRGDPDHDRYSSAIADFWLTRDWDTAAHVAEFKRVTGNMAGLAGKVDRGHHPFSAHARSHRPEPVPGRPAQPVFYQRLPVAGGIPQPVAVGVGAHPFPV